MLQFARLRAGWKAESFLDFHRNLFHHAEAAREGILMTGKKYRSSVQEELKNPDYTYIKRDLRRILLIAVSFVIVMVILAIIIK